MALLVYIPRHHRLLGCLFLYWYTQMAIQEAPEHASLVRQRHLEEAISQWKPQISTIMIQFYRQFRASGS